VSLPISIEPDMREPAPQDRVNPKIILFTCLAVAAAMFAGSILISIAAVQAERSAPPTEQSDP
jgi:hypothetical protein